MQRRDKPFSRVERTFFYDDVCDIMRLIPIILIATCLVSSSSAQNLACTRPDLQRRAREWAAQHDFAGTVLVEHSGKPLVNLAFGMADREHLVPNTPDTVFRIGSITKLFTATAIMHEIAIGTMQADTKLCVFLDKCPPAWASITVQQALTHSDGLADIVRQPNFVELLRQPTSPARTLSQLFSVPLLFPPGTDVAYGNTGMIALSAALEKVTGKPYAEAILYLVSKPAHLALTRYDDPAPIIPGRARGYKITDGVVYNADYIDMTLPSGAGGLISTTGDLDRFTRAFVSNELLPPELTRDSLTPKNSDFGYGWQMTALKSGRQIWHIGDINGFGSFLAFYPEADIVAVALTNDEGTPVRNLVEELANPCLRLQN